MPIPWNIGWCAIPQRSAEGVEGKASEAQAQGLLTCSIDFSQAGGRGTGLMHGWASTEPWDRVLDRRDGIRTAMHALSAAVTSPQFSRIQGADGQRAPYETYQPRPGLAYNRARHKLRRGGRIVQKGTRVAVR